MFEEWIAASRHASRVNAVISEDFWHICHRMIGGDPQPHQPVFAVTDRAVVVEKTGAIEYPPCDEWARGGNEVAKSEGGGDMPTAVMRVLREPPEGSATVMSEGEGVAISPLSTSWAEGRHLQGQFSAAPKIIVVHEGKQVAGGCADTAVA
jgi:hypothetical protein